VPYAEFAVAAATSAGHGKTVICRVQERYHGGDIYQEYSDVRRRPCKEVRQSFTVTAVAVRLSGSENPTLFKLGRNFVTPTALPKNLAIFHRHCLSHQRREVGMIRDGVSYGDIGVS
jgi:hypothetical protein